MARRTVAVLAGLIACIAGVLFYLRSDPAPGSAARQRRTEFARELRARATEAFAGVEMRRVSSLASPGDVAALLRTGFVSSPIPDEAGPLEDLLIHVSEFIYHRFVQSDPSVYRAWRAERGYELVRWESMVEAWGIDDDYAIVMGRPAASGVTSEAAFDEFWMADADPSRPWAGSVVGLAGEPRGIVMGGSRYIRGSASPRLTGDVGADGFDADLWDAQSLTGYSRWYGSRRRAGGLEGCLMFSIDPLPFVDVGVIMEFRDGKRVPVRIGCVWDPVNRCWGIETLGAANYYPGKLGPKVF